jgi:hypothetical protein
MVTYNSGILQRGGRKFLFHSRIYDNDPLTPEPDIRRQTLYRIFLSVEIEI